jgi:hypothetical protein
MAPLLQVQPLTQKGIGLAVSGELLHLNTAWGGFLFLALTPFPYRQSNHAYLNQVYKYFKLLSELPEI